MRAAPQIILIIHSLLYVQPLKLTRCLKSTAMTLKYHSTRLPVDKKTSLCLVSLLLNLKNNSHIVVTLLLTLNKCFFLYNDKKINTIINLHTRCTKDTIFKTYNKDK